MDFRRFAPNIPVSITYGISTTVFVRHCNSNVRIHGAPKAYTCGSSICQEFNDLVVVFNPMTGIAKYYRFSKEAQIW